jgi:hypothetical protein
MKTVKTIGPLWGSHIYTECEHIFILARTKKILRAMHFRLFPELTFKHRLCKRAKISRA